jgi:hypothetical protein
MAAVLFAKNMVIGSGGVGGNYYKVAQDIVDFCSENIKKKYGYDLVNKSTKGSVENLNGLLKKKLSLGFVQEDVYFYFKRRDQLNTIENKTKMLFHLYPEYIYILIPKGWKPKSSGFMSLFENLFNTHKDISIYSLKNQTVYAKGGALVSAEALSYFLGLNLKILDASKHKVDGPFIFVTGSGDERIQKMLSSGKWILLSFNGNELANKVSFYKPAEVTYIVDGKAVSAKTAAVMSNVYARKYRSKKRKEAVEAVKECVKSKIDELIDDGESDKWTIIQQTNGWGDE